MPPTTWGRPKPPRSLDMGDIAPSTKQRIPARVGVGSRTLAVAIVPDRDPRSAIRSPLHFVGIDKTEPFIQDAGNLAQSEGVETMTS